MGLAFAVPSLALWHDELWNTILDLSAMLDEETWALVGSQAIVAHALAHETVEPENTIESDPVGRFVTTSNSFRSAHTALQQLGFQPDGPQPPVGPYFRYLRAAEGSESEHRPQTWIVHVTGVTTLRGGDQAFARRVPYRARKGMRAPLIPVPDLLASVVYEASQFATAKFDPFSHARNAAFLVSIIDNPVLERARLTPTDRRALRVLDAAVGDRQHSVWTAQPFDRDAFTRWRLLLAL